MKAAFIIILSAICFVSVAQSQQEIKTHDFTGFVFDESQQGIEYSQIVVKSFNGQILSYAFSDSLGGFRLHYKTNQDSVILGISRVGYFPVSMKLSSDTRHKEISLRLSSNSKLTEVVITGDKVIETKGDTINYFIHAFSDGTERNAEDILGKLPGVSVDKNSGTIKYQGKEIQKILLDGDDLTGRNYKVLSKNLSADWLEEVEVIKRFTDSRLLQGIQQSNEVAINLKLKEEVKAPLFGTIDLGAGTTSKYTGKSELLSYQRNMKNFAVGVVNNTGVDLEVYDLETYASTQLENKGFILPDKVQNHELTPPDFFSNEKFIFHEGQFFSNSMVVNLSPKTRIQAITALYNNKRNFNFTDSVLYILPNLANLSIAQNQNQSQKFQELFQSIKITHQISEHKDIESLWQVKRSRGEFETKNKTNFQENIEISKQSVRELFGGLSYINRLNPSWVAATDIGLGFSKIKEEITLRSVANITEDSIRQSINQPYFNIGLFSRFDGVLPRHFYTNIQFGGSYTSSTFNTFSNVFVSGINPSHYNFNNIFGEIRLEKHLKALKFSAGGRLRNAKVNFNSTITSQILFEPMTSISLRKVFHELIDAKIKALYNTEYVFLKPNQLFEDSLITNFRSIVSYSSNPKVPVKNDLIAIFIKISEDSKNYLSANIELGYLESNNILVTNLSFNNDLVMSNQRQGGKLRRVFSIFSIDKYFAKINTSVKLTYENGGTTSPLVIENSSDQNRLKETIFNITSGTSINRNINLSLAYKKQRYTNDFLESTTDFSFDNYVAKVRCKISKQFSLIVDFQSVNFNESNSGLSSILGSRLSFENKKISLELNSNNLLNTRVVTVNTIESSIFSSTSHPLLPRFFLLVAKFKF